MLRIGGAFLPDTLMSVYGVDMKFVNVLFFVFFSVSVFAGQTGAPEIHPGLIHDDKQLIQAVSARQNQYYVEAGDLVVSNILPDDTQGLPHQKWEARLSNGTTITIVYNSDMGDRVPVQIGTVFAVGGQFIWTKQGGLVHWVHQDPKQIRPDGYVLINDVVYGDEQIH